MEGKNLRGDNTQAKNQSSERRSMGRGVQVKGLEVGSVGLSKTDTRPLGCILVDLCKKEVKGREVERKPERGDEGPFGV